MLARLQLAPMKSPHASLAPASLFFLLALSASTALGGCGKAPQSSAPAVAVDLASHARQAAEPGAPNADRAMRITIETSVQVSDLGAASSTVRAAVSRAGGYVGEARTSGSDEARYASFELHVPVAQLPAFRAEIGGLGDIVSDAEKAEDVTEQRADIKARLGNARAGEKRLLELLDKHTGNLADVVAVEKELASTRETIERMEAQERVLEGQIKSATVKLQLSTRHTGGPAGPGKRIMQAAGDGIQNAGAFLVGLAVLAASTGPTLLLLALIGYAIFRTVRFFVLRARANDAARQAARLSESAPPRR
ncbi:putative lipoprotein [Minicystis rosea]|nr:putative lipoprotein [Minicystis rosea]